ncbi:CRISPR-associated helicase Cas3' [uncultured Sphaerotilus sp.]|uniref:CRISPR-associated helicase Cas3' n=1 Tax=uncultured Sphaerotilus sp. TaxID=474984 RepID=UPI0030CA347E
MHDAKTDAWAYWGKARPSEGTGGGYCHLLVYHALDVAAVGAMYLRRSPALRQWLRESLCIEDDSALLAWVTFWLALHDLGKFSLSFQSQRPDLVKILQGEWPPDVGAERVRHDTLGMGFWAEHLQDRAVDEGWFGPDADCITGVSSWAQAVTGHHGQPPQADATRHVRRHFRAVDVLAATAFVESMRTLFLTPEVTRFVSAMGAIRFEQVSQRLSWWVAGVAVLADWIGSNAAIFRYRDRATSPLADYWCEALGLAGQALDASGVLPAAIPAPLGFTALFPVLQTPSPLQQRAATMDLPAGPQIHLLEDVTGAGKTEAAMMLAHRLMASGVADGYFIGLPTMATANAMYGRLATLQARLFAGRASLVLAHGRKDLVEEFAASVIEPGDEERDAAQGDDTATSRCTRWLADHNKRALLAPAGVGTVDQALLAVLQGKHQSLRLLGLFRKVLIVDEVHACDDYMQGVLEALLEFHAMSGGSAILLSATLPARMKRALLKAYARGRGEAPPRLERSDYPLTTAWPGMGAGSALETPVATRSDVRRTVRIRWEPALSAVVAGVAEVLRAGQCVIWIRNTVSDALQARDLLADQVPAESITLFHARFTLGDRLDTEAKVLAQFGPESAPQDRRGRLLIATQVAEQSLDVDADLLVSDLAPMDRIIQRAGRLRRHTRDLDGRRCPPGQPDARGEPCLWVHGPAWTETPAADWFKQLLPKAAHVYADHSRLWLTAQQLQRGAFTMPDDARRLVEAVYGEDAELPAALESSNLRAVGKAYSDRSISKVHQISATSGYERSGTDWLSDTSAPSRLGDESVDVVLGRWAAERVIPWRDDKALHAWAYSTVRVPRRLLDEVPLPEDTGRQRAIEAAKETMPGGGRWVRLLVMADTGGVFTGEALAQPRGRLPAQCMHWRYDAAMGLVSVVPASDESK